jgi:hypothetical protein
MAMTGWKKVLVTSVLLAAAGVLACVAALFDIWVPQGSLLAFVLALPFLAAAVIGIMFGFIKACDTCEDWLQRRRERLFGERAEKDRGGAAIDHSQRSPREGVVAWT